MTYNKELDGYGDLMTIEEYLAAVRCQLFTNDDGFGEPVKDLRTPAKLVCIKPSMAGRDIPEDATHIVWHNK